MENPKKKTLGRRKIAIKKIEKKTTLQVAFTKRRGGLFRKASELAVLCGVEIAILVKSPAGKLYSFAHPSLDPLINRAGDGSWSYEGLEQLLNSLEEFGGNVEENMNNSALPLSIYEQPSSSANLMAADNFVMDAAPPLSLQQLIAADSFYEDQQQGLAFFS